MNHIKFNLLYFALLTLDILIASTKVKKWKELREESNRAMINYIFKKTTT